MQSRSLRSDDPAQLVQIEIGRRDARDQRRIDRGLGDSRDKRRAESDCVAGSQRDDLPRIRGLIGVDRGRMQEGEAGASAPIFRSLGDAPNQRARGGRRESRPVRAGATGEWRCVEQRHDGHVGRRRAAAARSAGRERQHELRDDAGVAAGLRCMEARECQPRRRSAVRRQHRRAARLTRGGIHSDEGVPLECVHQVAAPVEVMVEIAREAIVGDEDVRFATQAPAQRGTLPASGACQ